MDPTFLEIRARASFRRVLVVATLKQSRESMETHTALKATPAARMVSGVAAALVMARPLPAVMNSLSWAKTPLENAVNAEKIALMT